MDDAQINKDVTRLGLLIFLTALAVRLFVLVFVLKNPDGAILRPDSTEYVRLAHDLAGRGVFDVIKRGPVYPAMLALMALIFKTHFVIATVAAQALLDSLTAALTFKIAELLFADRKPAAAAGLIYAFCPVAITSAGLLMTETLFSFLAALSVYCILKSIFKGGTAHAAVGGLLFGAAALTRTALMPLFYLFVPFVFFLRRENASLIRTLLFACGVAVAVLPWVGRNYSYYGRPVVTNIVNYNLYCFEAPSVKYISEKGMTLGLFGKNAYNDAAAFIQNEWKQNAGRFDCLWMEDTKNPKENDRELIDRLGAEARRDIRRNPMGWAALHIAGIWQTLRPTSTSHVLIKLRGGSDAFANTLIIAFRFIDSAAFLLFLIGLIVVIKKIAAREASAVWILLLIAIFYMAFVPGGQAYFRFRAPVEFLISIVAAAGLFRTAAAVTRNKKIVPEYLK